MMDATNLFAAFQPTRHPVVDQPLRTPGTQNKTTGWYWQRLAWPFTALLGCTEIPPGFTGFVNLTVLSRNLNLSGLLGRSSQRYRGRIEVLATINRSAGSGNS